jgi:hypothetical protein
MTDELDDPLGPTELHGFEGTLFDPNWPEVRGIYRGLWFWEDWSAYYAEQLRWEKIVAQVKANMAPEMRRALGWE